MLDSNHPAGHRPTWARIDLDALASNFHQIKSRVNQGVKVISVVKANAYGHGALECACRLAQEGADWFGVALPEEGIALRDSGITLPILCLAGFWEGQAAACIQQQLVPVVYRLDLIEALDLAARDAGIVADVHVKVDTGMGRLGVRFDEMVEFADRIKRFEHIRFDGLMTQFAAADDPTCETLTEDQIERFENVGRLFRAHGFAPRCLIARHNLEPPADRLVIVSDDLALPFGKIRIRERGSAGGHNGLKSIIGCLGTNEFVRLRIGIQPDHPISDSARFVLDVLPSSKRVEVEKVLERSVAALGAILRDGVRKAMTEYNS
jgi:hypothetical protein